MLALSRRSSVKLSQFFLVTVLLINLAVIIFFWWQGNVIENFRLSQTLIAIAHLCGLLGAFFLLLQLLLFARIRLFEHAYGIAELSNLHRLNGYFVFYLLLAHVLLIVVGFALRQRNDILTQLELLLTRVPWVIFAAIAFVLLIIVVISSILIVKRRLNYEWWYWVHLLSYLAVILAFFHQVMIGPDIAGSTVFVYYWYGIYIVTALLLIWYRFLAPIRLYRKHKFKVAKVVKETPDVTSIYITGQNMQDFQFTPGQFAVWRLLTRRHGWQAHPFSLSSDYNGKFIRFTAKAVGDFTSTINEIQPGTKVIVDGPHGDFTPEQRIKRKVLFIAGGSGITPIRAMLEKLAANTSDIILLFAVRTQKDVIFKREIEAMAKKYKVTVHYIFGDAPVGESNKIDDFVIGKYVHDLPERDVFLCGPVPMMNAIVPILLVRGVEPKAIHSERFSF